MENSDLTNYNTEQVKIHDEFVNDPYRKSILEKMEELADKRSKFILTEKTTIPVQNQIEEDKEYFELSILLREYEIKRWPELWK